MIARGAWTGVVCASTRCVCHDVHAYRKAGLVYLSTLSFKSPMSEFVTPSGSLHIFFSSVRFIRLRHPIKSFMW